MTATINRHNGLGINPEEDVTIEDITITGYYMYTVSPDGVIQASRSKESNYTSYIIDIDGFCLVSRGGLEEYPRV